MHEQTVKRWLKLNGIGVEIGAFETPSPLIKPFYVDRFAEFAGKKCLADYWGDACHVPFRNNSLDYVVTSHVLKNNGLIYMVVPDRRYTFDHQREITSPEHMWADYEANMNQKDSSHVHEFLEKVDWKEFWHGFPEKEKPAKNRKLAEQYFYDIEHNKEFNMHFHVFEQSNLRCLINLVSQRKNLSWKILYTEEQFPEDCPNGILVVIRVRKGVSEKWESFVNGIKGRLNRNSVLLPDAQPLANADKMLQVYD